MLFGGEGACKAGQLGHPMLHAECVIHLCEVLCEKEQYFECQCLLPQIIQFLVSRQSPLLPRALRVLKSAYVETNQFALLDSTFESVISELKAANASTYCLAEVLMEWGDSYAQVSATYAALFYIQSLRLYQSVRKSSWYAIRVLQRLCNLQEELPALQFNFSVQKTFSKGKDWLANVRPHLRELVKAILSELPVVTTALSVCVSKVISQFSFYTHNKDTWMIEKLTSLFSSADDVESGEALLCLGGSGFSPERELIIAYASSHPDTLLSARLLTLVPGQLREAIAMMRRTGASELEIDSYIEGINALPEQFGVPGEKDMKANLMSAPVSFQTVDALMRQKEIAVMSQEQIGLMGCNNNEVTELLERALCMAEEINPLSSRYRNVLFALIKDDPEGAFLRVLQASPQHPLSNTIIDEVCDKLDWGQFNEHRPARYVQLQCTVDALASATPIHIAFLDRVRRYRRSHALLTSLMSHALLFCADNVKRIAAHYQQLQAELDWLCGKRVQITIARCRPQLVVVSELLKSKEFRHRPDLSEDLIVRGFTITGTLKYEDNSDLRQLFGSLRALYAVGK